MDIWSFLAERFDLPILDWIAGNLSCGLMDTLMPIITLFGDDGIFWIACAVILLLIPKTRKIGLSMGVALLIGLLVCNITLKPLVGRIRPYDYQLQHFGVEIRLLVDGLHDFSFPSGHTTNSFSCAWVLFKKAPRKWGVPALVLAILISLSRIYVGIHYPTDVLAGVVIGIGSASLALWLARKIERKWFRRLAKKFYRL